MDKVHITVQGFGQHEIMSSFSLLFHEGKALKFSGIKWAKFVMAA